MADSKSKSPTIYDVARRAGVSTTTVSLICGGAKRWASHYRASTILKVKRAARELAYKPSRNARGTRDGRTFVVSVLVSTYEKGSDIGEYYFGAAEVLENGGFHATLNRANAAKLSRSFTKERDGAIVLINADRYVPDDAE